MNRYFQSYEELDVHQLMLNDKPRTLAYKNVIFGAQMEFKDKIVMDVGAGTGILSVFCAQAGAKLVYAVEASELANIAKEVIIENKLENTIKVLHSKVEELSCDSLEKVDVIVSEWMGFYLLHEGMLDSILFARDYFLKPDGKIFPSIAKLYASPCELPSMYKFWDNVYGVSMKCIGRAHREAKSKKPEIISLTEDELLTEPKLLAWLNLECISADILNHIGEDQYVTVCLKDGHLQGICIWFEVEFPGGTKLSTGPMDEPTHWKQTAIVLPTDSQVTKDEPIAFKLELNRNSSNKRQYNIQLQFLDASEVEHDIPCSCHLTKCIITRTYIERLNDITDDA